MNWLFGKSKPKEEGEAEGEAVQEEKKEQDANHARMQRLKKLGGSVN